MKAQEKRLQWAAFREDNQIVLQIIGELSRNTLLPLWQQRDSFLAQAQNLPIIRWDLSQLERIDSAGFAFLCELIQQCQQSQPQMSLENVPEQLLTLSQLFGLQKWINPFLTAK